MRQLLASIVAIVLPLVFMATPSARSATAQGAPWVELRPADGGFRALFPAMPSYVPSEVPTALGPIRMHRWAFEAGEQVYQVIYADFPQAHVTSVGPANMLDNAVNRMRESVKAGSAFESDVVISLAGHPGREHVLDVDGYMMKGRSLLVGTRLYQVLAGTLSVDRATHAADIDRFITSFALIVR